MEFTGGTITLSENTIYNCYTDDYGGVIKMNGGSLVDSKSTYYNNAALRGGVFYCDGCDLESKGSTFYSNKAVMGGAIYVLNDANVVLEGITAYSQQAYALGGFLYVDGTTGYDVEIYIRDYVDGATTTSSSIKDTEQVTPSTHTYTFDTDYGGGIYIDGSEVDLYLTNVEFENLSAGKKGGAIYAENLDDTEIDGCTFTYMTAEEDGAAIYVEDLNDNFSINDSTFICKDSSSYV